MNLDTEKIKNSIEIIHKKNKIHYLPKGQSEIKPKDKFKVIIPATGADRAFRDYKILEKHQEYTSYWFPTFFNTKPEAINFGKYLETKIYRYLLSKGVVSQNATKSVHKYVFDLGDYTDGNKQIDWNKPLDHQLYKLFNLNDDQIKIIEDYVK